MFSTTLKTSHNLPTDLTMLDKPVLPTVDADGVALQLVARLREGERAVLLRLPELRGMRCQFVEEALIARVDALAYLLTTLRVQVLPAHEAYTPAQFQNMLVHLVQADVLARQSVVALL